MAKDPVTGEDIADEPTELELLKAEKAKLEQEVAAQKVANEASARAEEIKRVKAETELEVLKKFNEAQRTGNVQSITEDQWKSLEDSTGVSRQAYMAQSQITREQINIATQGLSKKIDEAEARARKAEEMLTKFGSDKSNESTLQAFFEEKPQFGKHKGLVKEFVGKFPESSRNDPAQMKDILGMAESYVRGKVGGTMKVTPGGSPRLGEGNNELDENRSEGSELDLTGLQTDAQVRTVTGLKAKMDADTREKTENLLGKFQSADKQGVVYSAEQEWAETQPKVNR